MLEGLPASGKTTVADFLSAEYGFRKVNESLGHLSGVNRTDDQWGIFQETVTKYALAKESGISAVIDRGYPSLLAWDYCAERLSGKKDFHEKKEWIQIALRKGELFEPDYYIMLTLTPQTSVLRRHRMESSDDVWSGFEGMKYCQIFYQKFFQEYKRHSKILSINAEKTMNKVTEEIAKLLA